MNKNILVTGGSGMVGKYLKNILRDLWKLKFKLSAMSGTEWKNLTSYERAQIRRTVGEIGYIVLTSIIGSILAASADESDDPMDYALALWANRLNSELRQYMSLNEFRRILGSPAVTMTVIERIFNLGNQFIDDGFGFGPYERYQTGKKRGQTKMKYKFRDVIPWWKQIEKPNELKEAMEYYTRNRAKFGR